MGVILLLTFLLIQKSKSEKQLKAAAKMSLEKQKSTIAGAPLTLRQALLALGFRFA